MSIGRGEFLIFQEIPRSSIISTFPISLLFEVEHRGIRLHDMLQLSTVITARNAKGLGDRLEPTSPAMCFKQGEIVGLFLEKAGVPINWKEIVGATVANHFRFAGFRNRRSRAYVDYMAGVFQISRNVRASTPVTIEQSGANEDSDTKGLGSEGEFESDTSEDDSDGDDDFVLVDFDEAEDVQGLLDNQLAMNMAEFADVSLNLLLCCVLVLRQFQRKRTNHDTARSITESQTNRAAIRTVQLFYISAYLPYNSTMHHVTFHRSNYAIRQTAHSGSWTIIGGPVQPRPRIDNPTRTC